MFNRCLIRGAFLGLILTMPSFAVAQSGDAPGGAGPIVTADWLLEHHDEVTVIHASRQPANYDETGFLADAPLVTLGEFMTERPGAEGNIRYLMPPVADFEAVMQGLGVDAGDHVVIAPAGNAVYTDATVASRLYWQLRYYGHDAVSILDGGVAAWSQAGGETSATPLEPAGRGSFAGDSPREGLLATAEDVEAVIAGDESATLVDNRPLQHFTGLAGRDYVAGRGHLPEAQPLPFNLFVQPRDGIVYWRSPDQVANIVAAMLPRVDGPVIDYCNSGHVSSLAWFAMSEVGGMNDVALYDGSLHEWTLDGDRPLVIGR